MRPVSMGKYLAILLTLFVLAMPVLSQEEEEAASNASAEQATSCRTLNGVSQLRWNKGMDCTFFGALNACLRYVGEQVSYEYLMGVSGAAFATRFHKDWNSASPDAALNDDHPKAALDAVGYTYDWLGGGMADAGAAIVESIDAGRPVLGTGLAGSDDWGLVVGYVYMGDAWLCRTYADKSAGYSQSARLPNTILVLREKRKPPTMVENVRRSIRLAVEFATGKKKLSDPRYEVGTKAYDAWIQALQSPRLSALTHKQSQAYAGVNAWIYSSLLDARRAGVSYLTWAAKLLTGDAKRNVEAAAAAYQEEVDILAEARQYAPYPFEVEFGPKWTPEMRAQQVTALQNAVEKEKAAIAFLERAQASLDSESTE